MITFLLSVLALVLGYVLYGRIAERVIGADATRATPCHTHADGVDYHPLPTWKVFLIQFLNIAGTGPIFGAIMGILFGPAAYIWIVVGCIFGGAVHDYMSGMISLRLGGVSLPEIIGNELGAATRQAVRAISLVLLMMVGAAFVTAPAGILASITSDWGMWGSLGFWSVAIFAYFLLATLLPIDKLIGRIYPLFGLSLLVMALGVGYGIVAQPGGLLPELTDGLGSHHPKGLPVLPMLCVTVACGAVSGFHGTQSPMMARCLKNERLGRPVFYGAMITEGFVALIWAAAAIKFAGSYEGLAAMGNPAIVVEKICNTWLGRLGGILALLGVVAAPITTGDTAMRSARMIAADVLHIPQRRVWHRVVLSLPLFALTGALLFFDFTVLWRYLSWVNQTFATFTLWAITVWLTRKQKFFWISFIPAVFMVFVVTSYILTAPEGFGLGHTLSVSCGVAMATLSAALFFRWKTKFRAGEKK